MRPRKALFALVLGAATALGVLVSRGAGARVEAEARYSKAQAYSAALRYLRVDLGYEVTEKDADAAYLIFKYQAAGQTKLASTGTLEIVDGEELVRIFVKLPQMPEYHERVLRDGLMRKLREEYGEPRRAKPAPKEEEKPGPDAGSDGGGE